MPIITTEIHIDAPVTEVWQVLLDFEAYTKSNPFITEIIRIDESKLKATSVIHNKKMIFKPTICVENLGK